MARANSEQWLEVHHEILACEWARDHGWLTPKLQYVGHTGWPDRTFIKGNAVLFIEFKRPKGGRRSEKQKWWVNQINNHGGRAFFCKSADEAIEVLKHYG